MHGTEQAKQSNVDTNAMNKINYGLFLVTANDNGSDNGCIVNTVSQVTVNPLQITVNINKDNLTHDMIKSSKKLAVSVLTTSAPFAIFQRFGLSSGRSTAKFEGDLSGEFTRLGNGLYGMSKYANAVIEADVVETIDCGTHTIFIAKVLQAQVLNSESSCSYDFYMNQIKPKPAPLTGGATGYVCKICGYIYDGEVLPPDFICPLCKHGVADFEKR